MTVEILDSCRLEFNRELTAALPAKINPEHQKVVFTRPDGEVGGVFSREALKDMQGNTEEQNLSLYGLSDKAILSGYWESSYAYLRPDASREVCGFELKH